MKRIAFIFMIVVALTSFTVTAFAIPTAPYTLTGVPGERMKSPTQLKKEYDGRAQVMIKSVYNHDTQLYKSNAWGWAEVWWFKTSTEYYLATSTAGDDNKVAVADGANGIALDYVSGRGQPGRNYKLAMRIPTSAADATYTYIGKWSPDNNFG